MKARSIKAVLLAASLIFPTWSFAQTKSKDAAAYTNRGIAKLQKSDWDGAIADFDRALQFDPKLAQAYDNRGDAKTETGDFDGAIADFNRALQLNPKYAKAYDNRGLAKLSRGDLDGAMADFNRALQFDPKLAPAYEARGVVKEQKGELDGAIADCNRAIELNPKLAGAYLNRGMAKAYKGDTDNAIADSIARCSSTRNSPRHMLAMAVRIFWLGSAAGLQAFLRIVATKSGISPPVHLDYSFALRRKRSSRQRTRHSLQCRAGNLGI